MNKQGFFGALATGAFVVVIAAAIGIGAYNAGVAHGIAESGRVVAGTPPGSPIYVWPWHMGFGFPLFPIFFLFFALFVVRRLMWWTGGPWGGPWGHGWTRNPGVPPAFDEWHRRAHAGAPPTNQTSPRP